MRARAIVFDITFPLFIIPVLWKLRRSKPLFDRLVTSSRLMFAFASSVEAILLSGCLSVFVSFLPCWTGECAKSGCREHDVQATFWIVTFLVGALVLAPLRYFRVIGGVYGWEEQYSYENNPTSQASSIEGDLFSKLKWRVDGE